MVEPCPFICLPFAFNLPFISFRGSFRLSFCPSRFRTFDSQTLYVGEIPAIFHFLQSPAVVLCSTLLFTDVNTAIMTPAPFFFSIIRPRFADSSLRFVLSPSVLPPLLCPLSEAPAFFSPTLRGGSQGRQGAGRSPKVLLWHACANLCQNT